MSTLKTLWKGFLPAITANWLRVKRPGLGTIFFFLFLFFLFFHSPWRFFAFFSISILLVVLAIRSPRNVEKASERRRFGRPVIAGQPAALTAAIRSRLEGRYRIGRCNELRESCNFAPDESRACSQSTTTTSRRQWRCRRL